MGVAQGMWREIQAGRGPDTDVVARLAASESNVFSTREHEELRRRIGADILAAGPLQDLLDEPDVTDVFVNGTSGVWVDRGHGLERAALPVGGPEDVRRLAVRLAANAGRRLDDASPYVDAVLPGGVRVHAILPPLVEQAAHISLRVPSREQLDLAQLERSGSLTSEVAELLRDVVRAKVAFVVSGGTGTGKTTLLGAMLTEAAPTERLVIVEDVRELSLQHPHAVRLEGRSANVEGVGEVALVTLVRQCLRMRPDRVVVGEVRGAEVRELMAALNTGHEGGCGTVHANALPDVPARFEALGALAGMSPEAVRTQLRSAIRVFIHLERTATGRRLHSIGVLSGGHRGLSVEIAWQQGAHGPAWAQLRDLVEGAA